MWRPVATPSMLNSSHLDAQQTGAYKRPVLSAILLGVIQGLSEFLPISSSGHLVVLASFFDQFGDKMEDKVTVNIMLHLGTLAAILVFYWRRIWALLGKDCRVISLLVVGSIPAAIVGIPLKKCCDETLQNPLLAGCMFLVTGAMLLWVRRCKPGETECRVPDRDRPPPWCYPSAPALAPGCILPSGADPIASPPLPIHRRHSGNAEYQPACHQ